MHHSKRWVLNYVMGQRRRRQPLAQGYALPLFPESDGRQSEGSPVAKGHMQTSLPMEWR